MTGGAARPRGALGLALAVAAALAAGAGGVASAAPASVRVVYRFDAPRVERGKGGDRVRITSRIAAGGKAEELPAWGEPGAPVLPRRRACILLPEGTTAAGVVVRPSPPVAVARNLRLALAAEEHAPADRAQGGGRAFVRGASPGAAAGAAVPERTWTYHGVGWKHGRAVALLGLRPVGCDASTGAVDYRSSIEVEVLLRPAPAPPRAPRLPGRDLELASLVDNPELLLLEARTAALPAAGGGVGRGSGGGGGGGGAGDVAYAVVTSAELAPELEPLAAARSAAGLPAAVFTLDEVRASYPGTRPDGGQDDATRVRELIQDLYLHRGLRYVLLAGDADGDPACGPECGPPVVPVRLLTTDAVSGIAIPADLYYGCLDGTFDGDADGVYGEADDGPGGGDVDLLFEVCVGRAPVDSPEEARSFVRKTLAYERSAGTALRRVLFVGEHLGFGGEYDWGGNLNDQILAGSEAYISTVGFLGSPYAEFFELQRIYDRDWPGQDWPPGELIARLEAGVHIVNHVGHADVSNVMKLTSREIDALRGEAYFLGYSQSCYAGAFDNQAASGRYGADSVVEHLVVGPSGAAAFIANARRGWASTGAADGPSQRFNRRFWDAVFRRGVLQWGAANDRSKEESIDYVLANPRARALAYGITTLGDPALTMRFASRRGTVAIDRPFYNPGEGAGITLIDSDLDRAPDEPDLAEVTARAAASGAEVQVVLTETGLASGVFRGGLYFVEESEPASGSIRVRPPDEVTVTYSDADRGDGRPAVASASARITAPLRLVGPCPPDASIGVPYEAALAVEGGVPPYSLRSESGYAEELGDPLFLGLGQPQGWSSDEGAWRYSLPFELPFYGALHASVIVSSNGYLELGGGDGLDFSNSAYALMGAARIAPLWADLVTSEGDIYIDEQLDSVTFRWFGRGYHTDGGVDFECELFADGTIRFGYGDGNGGLSPTIGVSAGDGQRFLISELSGRESLSQAPSVFLYPARLPDGLQVDAPTGRIAGTPSEVAQTEVAFVAEDFLGQRDELRCFFTVRPDGLAVESPREGDLWLKGSQQAVRWQWYGNAGARVRIDYNLDGSASVFPLAVAAGVPLSSRSFEWTLPAVPAPAARVRVRSLERPEIFATSGVFSIAGPTLLLASPRGGERWISGTRASVRWSSLGDTGPRVRVRYNTDGSTARFPLTLAGDAPNTGLLEVAVPATPSETCRLLIESASDPSASAASPGVFAIRAPSLTVRSPNGGECLRSGATVTVTWASEGVEAQEVLLDYNLDGGAAVFPFPLGSGRFPNTGSAPWTVPAVTTAAARLRIQSAVGPGLSDASDTPFAIAPRCELRVLAWVPYIDPAEQQVLGVQEAFARLEPGAELVLSTATAPGALRADLEGKEALVVLKQKQGPGVDFAALGRSLAEVFTEHIEAGGALVVCEQVPESEDLLRAMGLLDFQLLGEGSRLCETAEPLHPIASGVRPNFSGPRNTGWYAVRDPDAVHVVTVSSEGEREGTVVAARDVGFGRLALVGFDYFNSNDAAARILVNAARVPLAEPGVRLTAPVPRSVYLEGAEVLLRWVAAGDAQGPVRISYNLTGSSIEFPLEISASAGEGARGRLSWAAPPVPEGASYLAIRIRVESLAAPRHSAVLAEPLFVIRPLAVVTASLPEGTVGAPYRAQLSARGGVPPYHFDAEGLPAGLVIQDAGGAGAEIVGTPQAACAACQVSVAVTDSLGLTARASIPLPIVVRQITLVRPRGGELWLFGSTQEIQWTVSGDIGPTVNIGFNTDGSTTEFPFTIAEAAPAREPFLWELPPVTAPRCRLRVASNEHPSVFAVSRREISIVGPTIRLDVPNGGECWEPGKRKAIRWTSAGNPGGTVRIEYAPDGSLDEFPVLVAEAAPDTGDHAWTVPQEPAEEARVRVSFNVAPEVRDASDLPFRIGSGCKLSALLWSPCPGAEAAAEVVLGGLREREPDLEAEAAQVRRADVLAGLLANRDALAVLLTTTCDGVDPERLGREARPLLEGFVQAGGAVLLCGPTTATSRLLVGLGLLEKPLTVIASQAGLPCDVASVLHPGVSGVPLEFAGPEATMPYFETGPGFETLVRARGFPVVASRDDGPGRWTLLGFTFQALEPASARLLANAARPRPAGPGLRLLSPRPGAVFVAGEAVPVEWAARGGRSGTVRVLADLDGSGEFRHLAGEAAGSGDGGRLGWTAPAPEAGKFLTVRLEVRWADAPELPARSEGPFHITAEPLSIVTEALAGGYYLAEYSSEVRAAGGAPPYLFEAEGLPAGLILTSPDPGSAASAVTGRPLKTGSDLSVRIVVRDFLGSRAERTLRMEVLPSRIEILAPAGGEHILAGAPYEVRWRVHGYAGETLRVEYNVTGSTRIFQDEPIAAEVPAASSVSWTVPSIESATCMLRISGNDVRLSTVSDRPFAVSPPRIACLFPDGGEALETGTTRTIRWRSLGNPGGRVRIDLSLDAADEPAEYPIAVAEDAPDTGVFPWPVPRAASEACRVRIRSTSDPLLEDASAAPFAIRHVTPVRGLVWVPATGFGELEVRGAVAAVTLHENDFDWALSKAATPEALAAELVGKEAFLMVQQLPAPNLSFKALGRSLGPVLEDFARRGGTVVVLKQTGAALDFLPATGLLRPVELGRGFDVPCRVVFPGHPVVNQVPESFSARSATAWYDVPGDGVEVYAAAAGGAAGAVVAGRDLGDGRVVLVGFDYRDYTVASARVIANATRNTRHVERPRFVRGDANADGITDVSDAIFLVDFLYRGGRAPPCMDAADVDDSAVPGSPRPAVGLNDPVYLLRWLFLGGPDPPAPSPRAMPPQTCGPDRQFRDELGCDAYPPCGG